MFNNLRELITTMPDEKTCRDYVVQQRWNGKPVCPYCSYDKCYVIEGGKRFKCGSKTCYAKFSVTVGTVMEDSKIPICKWLTAIYLCTAHKKGISSYQLGKDIGVAQNSAWFMLHRIRKMMKVAGITPLADIVETDLTYVGGKISNKSNKHRKEYAESPNPFANKTSVLGLTQRQGNTVMQIVPENEENAVDRMVRENVQSNTTLITDEAAAFGSLSNQYDHNTVHHKNNEYARLHFHTNSIEGVFSHFKRMVVGTYHQLSYKHTQQYLNEFTYRFNTREMKDADRFVATFKNMHGKLPYKVLIASKDKEAKIIKPKEPMNAYKRKAVIQLLNGVIIDEHESLTAAADAMGVHKSNINACIKGKSKSCAGYQWIFA